MKLRFGIITALVLAGTASASGQRFQSCTTRILPYVYDQRLGLLPAPGLTTDQSRWFQKKGKKKYPSFCFSTTATYVMVTVRWTENREQTLTRTESAVTTGPVTTVVGQTGGRAGQPSEPIWGTQLRTWVTTWQTQANEVVHVPCAIVLIFETKDGKPLSPTTELRLTPVLQAKGVGRNAGRDALEFLLRHWDIRLEGCAGGSTATSCR